VGRNSAVDTQVASGEASATTAVAPVTTVAATTTAVPVTTKPPANTGPFLVQLPEMRPVLFSPSADGAEASGCSPGSGPLPDGVWFGFLTARDATSVTFDLACSYYGSTASEKAAEDGEPVFSVNGTDHYLRNRKSTTRTVPVAWSAVVYQVSVVTGKYETRAFNAWPDQPAGYQLCPSRQCGVWLYVNQGMITEIQEDWLYLPG
jgi:hypothetical protein